MLVLPLSQTGTTNLNISANSYHYNFSVYFYYYFYNFFSSITITFTFTTIITSAISVNAILVQHGTSYPASRNPEIFCYIMKYTILGWVNGSQQL